MPTSSINIKPIKNSSEKHNNREMELDYVRDDLTPYNQTHIYNSAGLSEILAECKTIIKEKTGRSMQQKAAPIREGVFIIKEDTTMDEVHRAVERIESELLGSSLSPRDRKNGSNHELAPVKVLQVHLHKDEGHIDPDTKQWKPNFHGHMVFDFLDRKTGKSIKWTKSQYSQLQDIFAEELGLERGVKSDKKHLSALAYKQQKMEETLAKQDLEVDQLNHMIHELLEEQESLKTQITAKNEEIKGLEIQMRIAEERAKEKAHEMRITLNDLNDKTRKSIEHSRRIIDNLKSLDLNLEGDIEKAKKLQLEARAQRIKEKQTEEEKKELKNNNKWDIRF